MLTSVTIPRTIVSTRILWYALFSVCVLYNFHRYIFKYSHGAYPKEGYQQTPLIWQAGKFFIVAIILGAIYTKSRFVNRIPRSLMILYSFLLIVLVTNIGSALIYGQILTDEIEYAIFAICVLPISFLNKEGLQEIKEVISPALNMVQYIVIASNWIVIFNYLTFRVIPFHGYEGIMMRFGGLWDDPNTLSIFSVFLLGYAIIRRQYVVCIFHVINIILALSLTGFLLMMTLVAYHFINTNSNKILKILLLLGFIVFIVLIVFINLNTIVPLYEAKRESIQQHATVDLTFMPFPLFQSVQFHETWLLSINVNYFPFSIPITLLIFLLFFRFFFLDHKSLQRLLFVLFFVSSLFLPFLYMFPVNFFALLFLVLYAKGVRF